MPERISIEPFAFDQQQIKFYGRRIGYCGTKPNMPINFLTDARSKHGPQCKLTPEEKTEVIAYVIEQLGSVRKTNQTAKFWPEEKPSDEQLQVDSGHFSD